MGLSDDKVLALCRRFRTRAKHFAEKAERASNPRERARLTASASALKWAAADLACYAGVTLPAEEGSS